MNLKKLERYLRVNLLGRDPRLMKKIIYKFEKHWSSGNLSSYLSKFMFRFKGRPKSSEDGGSRFLQNFGKTQPFFFQRIQMIVRN